MKSPLVVLVQPPIQDFYLTKKRTIPYGLASIAAGVRNKGFTVEIIDALATHKSKPIPYPEEFDYLTPFYGQKDLSHFSLFHEFKHFGYSFEHIATLVRKKQPLIVGISALFTPYWYAALQTAVLIKKFYPQCHIVMGGHHPTFFPEQVLDHTAIDFVIRGDGESAFPLLCDAIKSGSSSSKLRHIPGIAFKSNTELYINPPAWEKDLSLLPLPEISLINLDFYQRNKRHSAMVVSSRGCPMKCSYCSVSATSSYAPFRQRSVAHVIKEIKQIIANTDAGFIDFEDENLCLNKSWFMELFSQIKLLLAGKNIELRAMNGLYPPAIDEDIVSLMKKSGFKTLNLSLGSTSKAQLKKFNRPDVSRAFEVALSLAQKHNLECVSYIIAAAPGQNAQDSLNDLLYLVQQRTLVGLSVFYPAPGSLDYQTCKEQQLLPDRFNCMRSSALPLDDSTSRVEAITLLRLSRILNFMKMLKDSGEKIPEARSFDPREFSFSPEKGQPNRMAVSKKLLQWFLDDGKIRGIDPDGNLFEHWIDETLSKQFSQKIQTIKVSGVKRKATL